MGFAFNPFTGNFDQKGSGGGGSSYIDGEVQNFSALPQTIGSPPVDSAYLVREAEGTWLLARKPAGIYIRTGNSGVRADDWTYAGEFPDVFSDDKFVLYDETDSSKNLVFQLSGIATGTTRTITMPNANVTLPDQGTSTTDNVMFNEVTTDNNLTVGGDLTITNALVVGANGVIFANDPGESTALTTLATANRSVSLPDASGTIARTEDFASPPAIGNTTPAAGSFTTLNATGTTELVNGASAAGPLLMYRSFTNASNYERGFMRWDSGILRIGTERLGGSGNIDFELTRMGSAWVRLINSGLNIDTALRVNLGQPVFVNGGFIQLAASNGASSVILDRDGAGIFAQRNGAQPQTFRLYTTIGGTGNADFERFFIRGQTGGAFQIGTEKGGTGSARPLEFQTDGVTRMTIGTTGNVSVGTSSATYRLNVSASANASYVGLLENTGSGASWRGGLLMLFPNVTSGGSGALFFGGKSLSSYNGFGINYNHVNDGSTSNYIGFSFFSADNLLNIIANGLVSIGGTTNAFPALKRSSTTLQVRLANDSDFAPLECAGLTLNGNLTASTRNIVTDTTTGTKIGTDPLQKIGFFDKPPVVQPTAVADATDAATVITQLNALLSRMRDLGLIAT